MPHTILILHFGDLGDTVLTVPAIRALRRRFPDGRLVLLAKPGPGEFLRRLGLADSVIPVDKHAFDTPLGLLRPTSTLGLARLLVTLRRLRPDTLVIFNHLVTRFGAAKYALLALATGARVRVGLDNGRGWFLTHAAPDLGFGGRHEAEYWLRVAALLDAHGTLALEAPVTPDDRAAAGELLAPTQRHVGPLVAVHPGTGPYGPGRRWDPLRFARAFDLLQQETGARCVLVGAEEDSAAAGALNALLAEQPLDLVGRTGVGVLAAVLERMDVLIANDGGVGHLAAAVGTPVVSVFGPSNDAAWRPLTATVLAADLPCRPCFYRGFERGLPHGCGARQCMRLVTPEMVAHAARAILARKQPRAV